ncbi:hypothetical protein LC593_06200 [Nostoc sp. CHAB 5844]|nr:hypothetical protein [Nostoc sp. CHAB 5844]
MLRSLKQTLALVILLAFSFILFPNPALALVPLEGHFTAVGACEIDQALSSFAADAGEKIEVKCTNSVLGELWVNLTGDITPSTLITDLLTNSPKAQLEKFKSCLIDDARD